MWVPDEEDEQPTGTPWSTLFRFWDEIKVDINETFGRDLDDPATCARTPWHWFESRLGGLLSAPPRGVAPDGTVLPANRLQLALMKTE